MAALVKLRTLITPVTAKQPGVLYNIVRNKVKTQYDYMPGQYPKNEEERRAAAKKYGLHPAEYEPYPDDGMTMSGDYPKLPMIGAALRDPYYPWDYPEEKRNYNEVVHMHDNIMGEDRCDFGEKIEPSVGKSLLITFSVIATIIGGAYLFEPYPNYQPVLAAQKPYKGQVHYTFEPAE